MLIHKTWLQKNFLSIKELYALLKYILLSSETQRFWKVKRRNATFYIEIDCKAMMDLH